MKLEQLRSELALQRDVAPVRPCHGGIGDDAKFCGADAEYVLVRPGLQRNPLSTYVCGAHRSAEPGDMHVPITEWWRSVGYDV